jgi:hypothetical protein
LKHCLKYHGTKSNWQPYIDHLRQRIADHEKTYGLSAREISNPRKCIGRGPTPGDFLKLLKTNRPKSASIPFIEYLNSWLYRELSGQAHLNILELANSGAFFSVNLAEAQFGNNWEEMRNALLEEYRQKQIVIAITLMLAMSTEIEVHFNYNQREKIMFLWTILNEHSDMTKDFWDTRYEKLLN